VDSKGAHENTHCRDEYIVRAGKVHAIVFVFKQRGLKMGVYKNTHCRDKYIVRAGKVHARVKVLALCQIIIYCK